MKRSMQVHVRMKPETRQMWVEIFKQSTFKTQSALFRNIVNELYEDEFNNVKPDENEK